MMVTMLVRLYWSVCDLVARNAAEVGNSGNRVGQLLDLLEVIRLKRPESETGNVMRGRYHGRGLPDLRSGVCHVGLEAGQRSGTDWRQFVMDESK